MFLHVLTCHILSSRIRNRKTSQLREVYRKRSMSLRLEIHVGHTKQGPHSAFTITAIRIQNGKEIPYRDFGTVMESQIPDFLKARARNIVAFMNGEVCERLTIFNGSALNPERKKPHPTGKIPIELFMDFYQELSLINPK